MTTLQDSVLTPAQAEIIQSIEPFVNEHLGTLPKPVGGSWPPIDWLPDLAAEKWGEQFVG